MTDEAPVDIIMGTYNGAEFVQEQIEVLARTNSYRMALVDPR